MTAPSGSEETASCPSARGEAAAAAAALVFLCLLGLDETSGTSIVGCGVISGTATSGCCADCIVAGRSASRLAAGTLLRWLNDIATADTTNRAATAPPTSFHCVSSFTGILLGAATAG